MTAVQQSPGKIDVRVDGGVGWVVMNNIAKRNALSVSMMWDLGEVIADMERSESVRVVVVRGAGTAAFAAGADISEIESQQAEAATKQSADEAVDALFDGLAALRIPLIAMIHGYCIGAGVAVALSADIRLCESKSSFAIPAARLGIGYPTALTDALVAAVGPGHASEMLFTGARLDADTAAQIGLVNRVLAPDLLEPTVADLARSISQNAPLSIRAAKASIRSSTDPDRRADAERWVRMCASSQDAVEGQRSFMEKRTPVFVGK